MNSFQCVLYVCAGNFTLTYKSELCAVTFSYFDLQYLLCKLWSKLLYNYIVCKPRDLDNTRQVRKLCRNLSKGCISLYKSQTLLSKLLLFSRKSLTNPCKSSCSKKPHLLFWQGTCVNPSNKSCLGKSSALGLVECS